MRTLIAVPVYNEQRYIDGVLERLLGITDEVLIVDDGSTDLTPAMVARHPVGVIRHAKNKGYGHALRSAFRWAQMDGYDWIITMDCDGQHEPESIPAFLEAAARADVDVVSGSRYLDPEAPTSDAPSNRRAINKHITAEVNDRLSGCLGSRVTDAFCGFKAYRVSKLDLLDLTESGYAFPMQFWVQAAAKRLQVREVGVKLIYNDPNRTFGGPLDDDSVRLHHYRDVLHQALCAYSGELPAESVTSLDALRSPCSGVLAGAGS